MTKKIITKNLDKKNHKEFVGKPAVLALMIASIGMGVLITDALAEASLDPVHVIGQRESTMTQPGMNQAIETVKQIPGGASIVDMSVVGEGRVSTWTDSLGMAPGVFIQDRFGSEEARISMRGSALSRTFHSFGIKILQDGIPINYADGFFDMQTIDPSAARYVEVIRGANALGYGASTLGGAINYVSPTGYDSPKFLGRAEAGSFGYARLQAITGGVVKPIDGNIWDYNISANAMTQDGYRNHSAQNSEKVVANTGVKINADLESRFFVGVVRSRSQLPGTISKSRLLSTPIVAQDVELNQIWPSRFQRRDVDAQRIANKTVYKNGDTEYELATYVMHHDLWHPIRFGFIEQDTITYGGHIKVANKNKLFGSDNLLTFGYLPDFGTTQAKSSGGGFAPPFVQGSLTSDASQKSENHRFLVENKFKINAATTLITSLQYEEANRIKVDSANSSKNYATKYTQWIPRLGVIHNLNASSQVFANISKNFEPPIFDVATTMLAAKAQTGTTVEVGSRGEMSFNQSRDQGFWDVTIYRSQLKNEFQAICANNDLSCSSSITSNVPKTVHQGIELGAGALVDRHWQTRTALLFSDFRFDGDAQYGNNRMPGFPPVIIRSELLYRWSDVSNSRGMPAYYAGPKIEWVPTKAPMDNTNSVYNDPYAIFGFKAGGPLDQNSSWFVDARNLADKRYAATTNIGAGFGGNPGNAYYPGMGRSINIGLETKW